MTRPPVRPGPLLAACLALPLLILGYSWLSADRASRLGTFWDVPVSGYDPTDLLRGHFIRFQYVWPGLTDGRSYGSSLCIKGQSPAVSSVETINIRQTDDCPTGHLATANSLEAEGSPSSGKLYISQNRSAEYQQKLSDPTLSAIVRVRIDDNGALHPVSLSFTPKRADTETSDGN